MDAKINAQPTSPQVTLQTKQGSKCHQDKPLTTMIIRQNCHRKLRGLPETQHGLLSTA
jgi:hypothetical protein